MGREDFFPIKITEGPEAERRENLQFQDSVSAPFINSLSEHQDLNWLQAGGFFHLEDGWSPGWVRKSFRWF